MGDNWGTRDVRAAYGARSAEYIALLGAIETMPTPDRALITEWASTLVGPIIDAGCGPGHWTDLLRSRDSKITGIDLVPEFIESASARFPECRFTHGRLDVLPVDDGELGGVLAWYSLIHMRPEKSAPALNEFARAVRIGGSLLIGVFEGKHAVAFDHTVITAYFWSADALASALETAGFSVTDVHRRTDPGSRPHLSISAIRRADSPRGVADG